MHGPDLDAAVRWFDENQVTYVKHPEQGKMKDLAFIKNPTVTGSRSCEPARL